MALKGKIRTLVQKDWFVSLLLLALFLVVRGYKFGWDDQHVEIPLLKSLIDPALYPGDYYVQGLKPNFVSFLYPILAHLITIKQIPTTYLVLYLVSRYFLFFWLYKLWRLVSQQRFAAFVCVIAFILFGRVEEFIYRTFSHQEFSLAFAAAGLYFFYKERFVLASALLGIGVNFHALYCLFPMTYLGLYLLINGKKHGWKTLLKSVFTFAIFALPVLAWIIKRRWTATPAVSDGVDWVTLYKIACPPNFIFLGITFKYIFSNFQAWILAAQKYLLLIVLYALNTIHNKEFRENKKNHAIALAVLILLALSYVFTYIKPSRFVLDLNLVRNIQFLSIILMGYTALLALNLIEKGNIGIGFSAASIFALLILNDFVAMAACLLMTFLLLLKKSYRKQKGLPKIISLILELAGIIASTIPLVWLTIQLPLRIRVIMAVTLAMFAAIYAVAYFKPSLKHLLFIKRLCVILPLVALLAYYGHFHWTRVQTEMKAGGFWKLQRDWEDMQRFVRSHTPKNAKLMVPYDMEMGGFRIFSERTIICCYRDCGIVGFDYNAAVEWLRRLHDLEPFKVIIDKDIQPAIINALFKYKVNYIVFMRYAEPHAANQSVFEKIYQNDSFSLFKILINAPAQLP